MLQLRTLKRGVKVSIKTIHLFFIMCATLLSIFLGLWILHSTESKIYAIGSFLGAIALICYGWQFRKKLKTLCLLAVLMNFYLTLTPAWSCSVCMGDPASPLTKGLKNGILTLLFIIGLVLTGFIALFTNIYLRVKKQH